MFVLMLVLKVTAIVIAKVIYLENGVHIHKSIVCLYKHANSTKNLAP